MALRRAFAPLVGILAATACGSTVAGGTAAYGGGNPDGTGIASADVRAPSQPPQSWVPGPTGPAGGPLAVASTGGHAATPSGSALTGRDDQVDSTPTVLGRGVTATTINVGISVLAGGSTNTALTAAGASEAAVGDGRAASQAVIAYLNSHGGIAGRRVVADYREWDTTKDWPQEYATDCAHFTQDNADFAVVSQVDQPGWDGLAECLAHHRTPFLHNSRLLLDNRLTGRWAPYVYELSSVRASRWGAFVDAWHAGGFFDKNAKIGFVLWDDGVSKGVLRDVVTPALARYGLKVDDSIAVQPYYSSGAIGPTASQYQSAVLKFSGEHITHVIFLGTWSTGPFFFLQSAESQKYRPRYGLNSTELPNFIVQSVPKAQLHGSVDVGFWPTTDVPTQADPHDNAAQALCFSIIQKAGISAPSRFASMEYARTCDGLFFLRDALANTHNLTAAGLRQAADHMSAGYQSPLTFSTQFSAGRFDGVSQFRLAAFDDAAGCFTYRRRIAIG